MASKDCLVQVDRIVEFTAARHLFGLQQGVFRKLEFEIGQDDIKAFRNLLPDELFERLGYAPEPWIDRLLKFVGEEFTVRADDGRPAAIRAEKPSRPSQTGQTVVAREGFEPSKAFADRFTVCSL